jgi:hypothetical protein
VENTYLLWAGGGTLFALLLYGAYYKTRPSPPVAKDEADEEI